MSTEPDWRKWKPSDPTSPHWYEQQHFARLVAAHLSHIGGGPRLVRELVAEFRGLSSSAKQMAVLNATGLQRAPLTELVEKDGTRLSEMQLEKLLKAMQEESKEINPKQLGIIGRDHLAAQFAALGCEMESFAYHKEVGTNKGLPWILETAFAWCPQIRNRRIVTGVNFSPCIVNPFRELGGYGSSLDTLLTSQRATAEEPVVLLIHVTCPRVSYLDRGKSSIAIQG